MRGKIKKVVLAYSGGLDTSVAIRWLKENYLCEVIAFCADIGQGSEIKTLKQRAIESGADEVYIKDLKKEFVKDFVFPIIRAGAVYEGSYLLGTSIARPLIAKAQMDIAQKTSADAVSHGSTGKGNDQIRFELAYYSINPHIKVIAPWREWNMKGRSELMEYAKKHKIPITTTKKRPYSTDSNLFHISFEGGILEDIEKEPPEEMFVMTVSPENAPDKPTYVEIGFLEGNPISINNKRKAPVKLLEELNSIGGKNAIGRVDCVENRFVGMKSRGVYETPGGTILHAARRTVETITMDRELMHLRDSLITRYSELIYYGYWFSPERTALQKFMDACVKGVTGSATVKLYKGNIIVTGRKAANSLYHPDYATFEEDTVYNHKDAEGFIKVNALRLKLNAMTSGTDLKSLPKKTR